LFHADRRTDGRTDGRTNMTKPIVDFRYFANAPKKPSIASAYRLEATCSSFVISVQIF